MIEYKRIKNFTADELERLFSSVGWKSANYPNRLVKAMEGSAEVFSAWENGQLIGLANAITDGEMTAYIHYLLVDPNYQGKGVGSKIMEMVKECFKDYISVLLIAENKPLIPYYERLGFTKSEGAHMIITNY